MFSWIAENPVSSVFFLVSFFCLAQAWFLKKDFFSPVNVYCFSQSITLAVAYLKLDYAMSDFKPITWLFWIGAMVCFCGGGLLVHLVAKSRGVPTSLHSPVPQYGYNWKLHVLLAFGVLLLFLVGIFGIIKTVGNLILLTDDPASWMTKDTNYGYFPIFMSLGPLCILLFEVASFSKFNPVRSVRNVARVMTFLVIVLSFMAYPNRGTLFFSLGFLVILYNYLHKRISSMWLTLCLALAILAFVAVGNMRNQYGGSSIENVAMQKVMLLPYMYVANNYWNFDYAINPPSDREYHPHTYGIDFFFGAFEYTGAMGAIRKSARWDGLFDESIQKIGGFNTANYLWEVYKDLYTPGVFLLPLILGMALSLFYLRLSKPFSPRVILFYTVFIYFVGWWFFTPGYKQGIYWAWLVMMYFISTVCMKYLPLPANAPVLDKVGSEEEGKEQIPAQGEERDSAGLAEPSPDGASANV